jgi:TolA-binding protein
MRRKGLLLILVAFSFSAGACHKKSVSPPPVPARPAAVSPPPVPVPETWPELPLPPTRLPAPPEPPLPTGFREGETSYQSGRYQDAIRAYERYVRDDPVTQYKDAALFRLGISYTLACTAPDCRARALERSQEQFKRLLTLYPRSPYGAEARFILGLQADVEKMAGETKSRDEKIKKLTEELEQLKKIDLERQPRIKK